jgi:hypothetical protein
MTYGARTLSKWPSGVTDRAGVHALDPDVGATEPVQAKTRALEHRLADVDPHDFGADWILRKRQPRADADFENALPRSHRQACDGANPAGTERPVEKPVVDPGEDAVDLFDAARGLGNVLRAHDFVAPSKGGLTRGVYQAPGERPTLIPGRRLRRILSIRRRPGAARLDSGGQVR